MPKSIISYVASNNPFSLKVPIIQKREEKSFRNWKDRKELLDYIESLPVPNNVESCIYVKCHCGVEHNFLTKIEIPDKDFTCTCGRIIIKYGTK